MASLVDSKKKALRVLTKKMKHSLFYSKLIESTIISIQSCNLSILCNKFYVLSVLRSYNRRAFRIGLYSRRKKTLRGSIKEIKQYHDTNTNQF